MAQSSSSIGASSLPIIGVKRTDTSTPAQVGITDFTLMLWLIKGGGALIGLVRVKALSLFWLYIYIYIDVQIVYMLCRVMCTYVFLKDKLCC